MMEDVQWWCIFVGYSFSIIPSSFFIKRFSTLAYQKVGTYDPQKIEKLNLKIPDPYFRWTSFLVGILERIIYTTSVLTGLLSFIPVWLALKAISQWINWEIENGRAMFNIFLIGTGLSIFYGTFGGKLVFWLNDGSWVEVIITTLALIFLSLYFVWFTKKQKRYDEVNEKKR